MQFMESTEVSEKIYQLKSSEQATQPNYDPVNALPESTQTKQMATGHMDEVSRRFYKVLYGYNVDLMESDNKHVSVVPKDIKSQKS